MSDGGVAKSCPCCGVDLNNVRAPFICKCCGRIKRPKPAALGDVKWLDAKELKESGLLQEINRRFLHPIGLALAVSVDDETGEYDIAGLWDYRDDPEGIVFDGFDHELAEQVGDFIDDKHRTRKELLGYVVQG